MKVKLEVSIYDDQIELKPLLKMIRYLNIATIGYTLWKLIGDMEVYGRVEQHIVGYTYNN